MLPRVPVRQWVLSFPYEIRYRLAWDGEWVSAVLAVFLRVVGGWYRRQAQALGNDRARWGSVTFVQRFGSSLNLNPHLHVLMLDGVYVDGEDAPVCDALCALTESPKVATCRLGSRGHSPMRKTRGTRDLRLRGLVLAAWCGVGPLADDAHAQSGHSLRGNAVVVEGESHWNNWSFPAGTLKIDAGGVRPRLWRRHTNAVRDIVDNLRFNPPII